MKEYYPSGIYETIYGNTAEYIEGEEKAYDLDMGRKIPLDMVDFNTLIEELD